jgi:hypothetical protein
MQIDADFSFSDVTINEADGEYEMALSLMEEYEEPKNWTLTSRVTVLLPFGTGCCDMKLEFKFDGRIVITSFEPSDPEPTTNFDLRCLNAWAAMNGWLRPEPSAGLVMDRLNFWKHMWEVNMCDSPYLEEKYGKRPDPEDILPPEEDEEFFPE